MSEALKQLLALHTADADERHARNIARAERIAEEAAQRQESWVKQQAAQAAKLLRYERIRALVCELIGSMVEAGQNDVPIDEILWRAIVYCTEALGTCDLDEPLSRKLGRLARKIRHTQFDGQH